MSLSTLWLLLSAYLIGSFPTAYLVGRRRGIDIRSRGSGNMGTMNARLVLGWSAALVVLAVDLGKGMLTVWLSSRFGINPYLALSLAVTGHIYPLWLHWHGGKGLAVACGGLLLHGDWGLILLFGVVWAICYLWLLPGNDETAGLSGAAAVALAALLALPSVDKTGSILLALVIVWKHFRLLGMRSRPPVS